MSTFEVWLTARSAEPMVAEGRAEMDEAEVAFDRALLQKRGQIRRRAIRELERA